MGPFNKIDFVSNEIKDIASANEKPSGGIRTFGSRIAYALSLGLKEKEIVFFGLMQWAAIGIGYLLWVQMLDWMPEKLWGVSAGLGFSSADGSIGYDGQLAYNGSIGDWIFLAWSFACVGAVAFPVGILTGCIGAAHFLHKQGRESSIATCFKLVLPQSWSLWSFHWIDGWITVLQILQRLPGKGEEQTPEEKALKVTSYYAWKLGVAGVLPSIVTGNNLIKSAKNSVIFVKDSFLDVAKLRAGYLAFCWIVGIGTYAGTILFLVTVDGVAEGNEKYALALWAAVPIANAVAIIALLLRPIYVLALCDLYSDHLARKGVVVELADNPSRDRRPPV